VIHDVAQRTGAGDDAVSVTVGTPRRKRTDARPRTCKEVDRNCLRHPFTASRVEAQAVESVRQSIGPHGWHAECDCETSRSVLLRRSSNQESEVLMLYYAIVFFVIALVAALFGFGGIAAGAAGIAKILFFAFLVIAIVTFLMSLARRS
jgi:uncharacterized membrane protein YtjA (UPF0391 family)